MGIPRIIAEGKTPAQWADELHARGIDVSERTLRERARAAGACRSLGKAMILLPEHIEQLFAEPTWPKKEASKNTGAGASGGSRAVDLIPADISERALAHLMKESPKPKSMRSMTRRGNVVSLVPTPQSQRTK